jgi:Glycosyl hydrolase 109, C-terminal domain/Oxidoreductase family, NAD-binding Rossmann fold
MTYETRREFLKLAGGLSAGLMLGAAGCSGRAKPGGKTYMVDGKPAGALRAKPIGTVRIGVIGVGDRGMQHIDKLVRIKHTQIVAVADPHKPAAKKAQQACVDAGHTAPDLYTDGGHDYKRLLERDDIDAVWIATPWRWHCPQGTDTMLAGKHAFIEVPMALTLDELWQMVETSEKTGRHCMMMENVNFGRDELLALNLCRRGVLGDLTHGEAAYIHDLRYQMKDIDHGTGSWRTGYHTRENGNLYPTHGLGPVAQYMNVDRTDDRFDSIVSMSSPSFGRQKFADANFPPDHPRRQVKYISGDMSTSIIKTHLGRTIMVQWDTCTPRPYSRHNLIQGANGVFAGFPTRLALEGRGSYHHWTQGEAMQEVYDEFEHPLWLRMGEEAERVGGHGGMDFIMNTRIIECLRSGEPMDQNVYEGASWSAVRPLSAWSVAHGGKPIGFPDFTRGKWRNTAPLGITS